jgi:ribose-phosphate pyrophosphokinase
MNPLCLPLPGNEPLGRALADRLGLECGTAVVRPFPDQESYVRIDADVAARGVVLVCTLDRPDRKIVQLLLLAATARDLGATCVGLVAPYLAYLRQDDRFRPGEGVTSRYVAALFSSAFDWLVTVDPHLHRHRTLDEVYRMPTATLHSAPLLAEWIAGHVVEPVIVGPDAESRQWAAGVAGLVNAPYLVLEKVRRGDRDVDVRVPGIERWPGRTPVLVDDVLSTGRTLVAAVSALRALGLPAPVVMAVHAVFADAGAGDALGSAGAGRVVTTNTIAHPSNDVDVTTLLADGTRDLVMRRG